MSFVSEAVIGAGLRSFEEWHLIDQAQAESYLPLHPLDPAPQLSQFHSNSHLLPTASCCITP